MLLAPSRATAQSDTVQLELVHRFAAGTTPAAVFQGAVFQASDFNFYGIVQTGYDSNSIFRVSASTGALTILRSFPNVAASTESYSLIEGNDLSLYGTTPQGGASNCGTVFRLTLAGAYTVLYDFVCGAAGSSPRSLIQGLDGNLYGLAAGGTTGQGVLFRLTPAGVLSIVFDFQDYPIEYAGLQRMMQGLDGWFYVLRSVFGSSTEILRVSLLGTKEPVDGHPGSLTLPARGSDGRVYYTRPPWSASIEHPGNNSPGSIVAFANGINETIATNPNGFAPVIEVAPGRLLTLISLSPIAWSSIQEIRVGNLAEPYLLHWRQPQNGPTPYTLFKGRDNQWYAVGFDGTNWVLLRVVPAVTLQLMTSASSVPTELPQWAAPPNLVAGQPTTWTMNVLGAAVEYKFWIYGAAGWRVLQDYGDGSPVLNWTPAQAGQYIVQVWMRRIGSTAPYDFFQSTTAFNVGPAPPPVITSAQVLPAFPAQTGNAVTLRATAQGGIAPLQYQFWVLDPDWQIIQPWGTSNQIAWVPQSAGSHVVQVWVRSAGSTAAYDTWQGLGPFTVAQGPLTVIDLSANYPAPVAPGQPVTFTATTTGGSGLIHLQFYRYSFQTQSWTIVQNYGPSSSWTWTPGVGDVGAYSVEVWARRASSSAIWESWLETAPFVVAVSPLTLTLTSNQTGTDPDIPYPDIRVPPNTPITWRASANAPPAAIEYQFWRFDVQAGTWSIVQPYSTNPSFSWTPALGETGRWAIQVWARPVGSAQPYTAWTASYVAVQP